MNATPEERISLMVIAGEQADPGQRTPTLRQIAAMIVTGLAQVSEGGHVTPSSGSQYLTKIELCNYFGYSGERMHSYLRRMRAEGKVRVIRPTDENGTMGNFRYHVGDVEACMLIDPIEAKH